MRARLTAALTAGALLGAGLAGAGLAAGPPLDDPRPVAAAAASPSSSPGVPEEQPSPSRGATPPATPSPSLTPPASAPTEIALAPLIGGETSPTATVDPDLLARLRAIVIDPAFAGPGTLGVTVVDGNGSQVLDVGGAVPMLPASAQKLVTAAGALAVLGTDFRFTTSVLADQALEASGTLDGDLVIVGDGDPTLASPEFAELQDERPRTLIADVADALVTAGVRRVTGQVVADPGAWADLPLPAGWIPDYLEELDGVRIQALTIDAGRRLEPSDGRIIGVPEEQPPERLAAQLHSQLARRGVIVDRGFAVRRGAAEGASGPELARAQSPPLEQLLRWTVQRSDNQMADQIFRAIGARAGDPTWDGAASAIPRALAGLGLDWSGTILADGSGLSREDRLTPELLAQLDRAMSASTVADEWVGLQAVAGRTGTLRNRLRETPAAGRLRGKTGTLDDVRSLAGGIPGPEGQRLHFAVVGNGLDRAGRTRVGDLSDALVEVMAEELYDCERIPVPQPTAASAAPQAPLVELRCAA